MQLGVSYLLSPIVYNRNNTQRRRYTITRNHLDLRINRQIRATEVRLIGEAGQQVGIIPLNEALALAEKTGLDLVEVQQQAMPPVCKLMDYGKFKYEANHKAKENKHTHPSHEMKEIKFRPKIDVHDYETKKRHVIKFLQKGHRTKVTVMLRGREQGRPEVGFKLLAQLAEELEGVGIAEALPKRDGRDIIMVLKPAG